MLYMMNILQILLVASQNRILGETRDQIEQILALVFENYKSLDEAALSGLMEVYRPATGVAAPALEPAVKLYTLLHDILSPEVQTSLCHYFQVLRNFISVGSRIAFAKLNVQVFPKGSSFQVAVKKRSRRHLSETDEYMGNSNEGSLVDMVTMSTAYQKMKSVCLDIRGEIFSDIEIHNQHILPRYNFLFGCVHFPSRAMYAS